MDLNFITVQLSKKTRYYTKLLRFIWRYSNGKIRDLAILKNFNMFKGKKRRSIAPMAFITIHNEKPMIFINKKDWPKSDYSLCKGILLHEIGHYKTGLTGQKSYIKEFRAQRWALNRSKTMHDKEIYKWLLLNFFLWGLEKNFNLQYRKASKLGYVNGIIKRNILESIIVGKPKALDRMFERYLKNIHSLNV